MLILLSSLCILYTSGLSAKNHDDIFSTSSKMENCVGLEISAQKDNTSRQDIEMSNPDMLFGDITEEDANLFINNVFFDMRYFPLSRSVSENEEMDGWYYYIDTDYANPEVFKKYFLQVMNEETFDYLYRIFDYQLYDGYVVKGTESELSRYEIDDSGEREFYTVNRTENTYHIKVPFIYHGLSAVEPKEDYGDIWVEKQSDGAWRITKISQWLNDLTCYQFKEYAIIYSINRKSEYEQFLKKYGENQKGERISTQIIRNGDYILPESNEKLLTESDLQPLNKISAVLAYYEIEARHGYVSEGGDSFISYDLYFTYFCPWFVDLPKNQQNLNDIEKKNQEVLQRYINNL